MGLNLGLFLFAFFWTDIIGAGGITMTEKMTDNMTDNVTDNAPKTTAKEIAEKTGVSKTRVNQVIKNMIENESITYSVGDRNTRLFSESVEKRIIDKLHAEKKEKTSEKYSVSESVNDRLISELKNQINEQNKQIAELHQLLSQEQQLRKTTDEKLSLIESENEEKKRKNKKHWWQFFK